jgi:hypothetical protein
MVKLFNQFLTHLGRPSEQANDKIALVVILTMFLSFITVVIGGCIVFTQVNQVFISTCKPLPAATIQEK